MKWLQLTSTIFVHELIEPHDRWQHLEVLHYAAPNVQCWKCTLCVGRTVRLVPLAVTGNWVVTAMAFIASVPSPIAIVNLSCISNYLPIEGTFHIWILLYYAPFSLPFCKLSASLWFNCAPFNELFNVSATEAVSNCDNSWLSFFSFLRSSMCCYIICTGATLPRHSLGCLYFILLFVAVVGKKIGVCFCAFPASDFLATTGASGSWHWGRAWSASLNTLSNSWVRILAGAMAGSAQGSFLAKVVVTVGVAPFDCIQRQ